MRHEKLVRDRIPEIIEAKGQACVTHVASDAEYWESLKEKLREEVGEFLADSDSPKEIVDIFEVLDAIIAYKKFNLSEIEKMQEVKARERGRFGKRVILEES